MNCFSCFTSKKSEAIPEQVPVAQVVGTPAAATEIPPAVNKPGNLSAEADNGSNAAENNTSRTFTFRELAMATKNFKQECLIGEGRFGKLYKGKLQSGEKAGFEAIDKVASLRSQVRATETAFCIKKCMVVAVKRLDRNGTQGNKEFLVEVLILTLLSHPNLVKLIGYCADGDQRLLVYEYLSFGSLDVHLHDISDDKKPLDWQARMKIASGVAQGLEYLHEKANPPILYRDLKPANILLTEDFEPRLSGYGLAKLVNGDTKMNACPRVMGTYGYCAPEYERQGELTMRSDVYSFGVILLQLITGRRALDTTRPTDEQNLVSWAQPMFREQKRFPDLADPLLQGGFPQKSLNQAVGIAAMCLQEEPSVRPLMGDVVSILSSLAVEPPGVTVPASIPSASVPSEVNGHESEADSLMSDDESDEASVSSENNDEEHARYQDEYMENLNRDQSQNFEKQGPRSQKYKMEETQDNANQSSRRINKNDWPDGIAQQISRRDLEHAQEGSVTSSVGNSRYEDSFAWSMGSSSNCRLDGSTRKNSGHIGSVEFHNSSLGLSMRQQSVSNS